MTRADLERARAPLCARHGELVLKKFSGGLTRAEGFELDMLRGDLDRIDLALDGPPAVRVRRLHAGLSLREAAKRSGLASVRWGEIERGKGAPVTHEEDAAIERVIGNTRPAWRGEEE
jgi:hypothetical protein